jgi:hypothetical protein
MKMSDDTIQHFSQTFQDELRGDRLPACQPVFLSFGETQVTNTLSNLIALIIHRVAGVHLFQQSWISLYLPFDFFAP